MQQQYSEEPTIRVRRYKVSGAHIHKGDHDATGAVVGMDRETVVHITVEGDRYPGPTPLHLAVERLTLGPSEARALGQELIAAADHLRES